MADIIYESPTEKGKEEAAREEAKKSVTDAKKLDTLIKTTNNVLISARSMLDLFPDQIDVEATRVILTYRQFLVTRVHTIDIENITEVLMQKNVFYTDLTFFSRSFVDNTETITKLKNKEAIEVKKVIDGLKIMTRSKVDVSVYSKEDLIEKLKQVEAKPD